MAKRAKRPSFRSIDVLHVVAKRVLQLASHEPLLPFLECLQTNGSGCAVTLGFCVSLCLSADNAARAPGGDRRHVPGQRLRVLAGVPPDRNQPGLLVRRLNARPRLDRWLSFRARSLTRACPRSGGICVLKYCGGFPIPCVCQVGDLSRSLALRALFCGPPCSLPSRQPG